MPIDNDNELAALLKRVRHIAVLGASANPERASHRVMRFLINAGYQVTPVNPGLAGQQLLGQTVVGALSDLDDDVHGRVDMIDVFRHADHLPKIVDEVIEQDFKVLWTQLDVVDQVAATRAEEAGVTVVMDRCPAIEIPRLQAAGLYPDINGKTAAKAQANATAFATAPTKG